MVIRSTCGGFAATRSARACAAGSSSASGTTRETKPHSSAVAASIASPVNAISLARAMPTARGNSQAPPSPGINPTLTKLSANTALCAAIRMSHISARSQPAPMAGPFTAAMVGISQS
ncbi:Uncharacterised protein [Mycobacteroides abscessus subsp. abscessus]|nr:Uncharacterised protein [Mycobacteroides abscessus subsp. abscessus]